MKLVDIKEVFREVNEHNIPYDIGVIRAGEISPVWSEYEKRYSSTPPFVRSVIVYVLFTKVAVDYYFREKLTPKIINVLNRKYGDRFCYDNYRVNRKQLAVRAGLGKIAKQSLVFSRKFGFNCKIDAIFTDLEFDEYSVYDGEKYHKECSSCAASPCISKCPVACKMEYHLYDVSLCDNHITPKWNTPELMCRTCIEECKSSEELLKHIPLDAQKRIWRAKQ